MRRSTSCWWPANDSHCELVCAALAAGKHVISEKPPAMSLAELDKMIATAEAHGRIFTVHQNRRWDKDFRTVKAVLESGELGNVYAVAPRCTARAARCSAGRGAGTRRRHDLRLGRAFCRPAFKLVWL